MRCFLTLSLALTACTSARESAPAVRGTFADCRNLVDASASSPTLFIAGRPDFQALQSGQVGVVAAGLNGVRLLPRCTVPGRAYGFRSAAYACESAVSSKSELALFVPALASRLGTEGSVASAYTFHAHTAGRFELASGRGVSREELEGVDCASATGIVQAFTVGDYSTRRADSLSGGGTVGPGHVNASKGERSLDAGQRVPLVAHLALLSAPTAGVCAAGRKRDLQNPSQCVIDEARALFALHVDVHARSQDCDWMGISKCDLVVLIAVPQKPVERGELPVNENHASYDLSFPVTASQLYTGIRVRAFDRDKMSKHEELGACVVQPTVVELRRAAEGSPWEQSLACGKVRMKVRLTVRR